MDDNRTLNGIGRRRNALHKEERSVARAAKSQSARTIAAVCVCAQQLAIAFAIDAHDFVREPGSDV
jgi:hypothetical protein